MLHCPQWMNLNVFGDETDEGFPAQGQNSSNTHTVKKPPQKKHPLKTQFLVGLSLRVSPLALQSFDPTLIYKS